MYSETKAFHDRKTDRGLQPVVIFLFTTKHGVRLWSGMTPNEGLAGETGEIHRADGTWLADGSIMAGFGSLSVIASESRVLDWGEMRESLIPFEESLSASLGMSERTQYRIVVDNSDGEIARIAAMENVLNAEGEVRIGFAELGGDDFLTRFRGRVMSYKLEGVQATLELQAV